MSRLINEGLDVTCKTVQVGISVYKQKYSYVRECLESVLNQSHKDTLIDIRLDGPDSCERRTLEWLRKIESANKKLTIHEGTKRLGIYRSYNSIFNLRKTPYLCQIDADDYINKYSLEILVAELEGLKNCGFAFTKCIEITAEGKPMYMRHDSFNAQDMLTKFFCFHLRLIKRNYFDAIGGYFEEYKLAADYDLCLKLNEIAGMACVDLPLYYHRNDPQSASSVNQQSLILESLLVVNKAIERRGLMEKFKAIPGKEEGEIILIDVNSNLANNPFYIIPQERHQD